MSRRGMADYSDERKELISSFLAVAVVNSEETAIRFLKATHWDLDDAIHAFYSGESASPSPLCPPLPDGPNEIENPSQMQSDELGDGDEDDFDEDDFDDGWVYDEDAGNWGSDTGDDGLRDPMPVRTETLLGGWGPQTGSTVVYDHIYQSRQHAASIALGSYDSFATSYCPPFALMHPGTFYQAKIDAFRRNKWLLINLQSEKEFSSHMLNRDTWSDKTLVHLIQQNFIFWQAPDDSFEGMKVCNFYALSSVPAILIIDPITGQKVSAWSGMIQPEQFLEHLRPLMSGGPMAQHGCLCPKHPCDKFETSGQSLRDQDAEATLKNAGSTYVPLPEEPEDEDSEHLTRVRIRLPNGTNLERKFHRNDPIKLLWSFCSSQMEEGQTRGFRLYQAIPGKSEMLDYKSSLTFEESNLVNCALSVTLQ